MNQFCWNFSLAFKRMSHFTDQSFYLTQNFHLLRLLRLERISNIYSSWSLTLRTALILINHPFFWNWLLAKDFHVSKIRYWCTDLVFVFLFLIHVRSIEQVIYSAPSKINVALPDVKPERVSTHKKYSYIVITEWRRTNTTQQTRNQYV